MSSDVDSWRGMLRQCLVELDAFPLRSTRESTDYLGWTHQLDLGFVTVTEAASDPVRVVRAPRMIDGAQDAF
ncbi:hypothetical protein [Streptomyces sp. 3N207]|uniref:hypothetical protein n=1 Tax=Streptomyces sp. 3N207 TaxID=3457417 RepID=UPI003FCEFEBE